jgi:predicted metal-dependent hydrolase
MLIAAPRPAIEYVVVHELAHFVHQNHSKEFYGLVRSILPDYKERKKMLKQ